MGISLERLNLAQTLPVFMATLAALMLLVSVLVYWTWEWFAPRAEPRAPVAAAAGGHVASANGLFGAAQRNRDNAAPTGIAIKLLGVVAGADNRPGYALVRIDAKKTLAVRVGEEVAPGVKLAEVHADNVVLERGGARETLTWPKKDAPAEFPATRMMN